MAGKKGRSGFAAHPEYINRKGRPKKGFTIAEYLREKLREVEPKYKKTYLEIFADTMVKSAINGDPTARKLIMQYIDGLPIQKVRVGNLEDGFRVQYVELKPEGMNGDSVD